MSESSASSNSCPKCGVALPSSATAGLCPRCLMAVAMVPTEPDAEPAAALKMLAPEELAPHFPQLEILEYLGRGGMGVVYKARQKSLNRLIALKLLAPERVGDAKFAERFAREAQALAALNHPNIVTIHDFGQAGGFYFLLMEYVDGLNLRQLLRGGKFTPEEALAIVKPLCDALQFAHDRGVIHRDIKPENLLLDKAGRLKVADFGIARMLGSVNGSDQAEEPAASDNTTQTVVGTPSYSAPEQKTDPQRVDSRADIYSLGVVFYEMLTGELPGQRIEAPSKKVQIDVRLDEVVLRALEQQPQLRYQQVSQVKTAVEAIAQTPVPKAKTEPRTPWRAVSGSNRRILVGMVLAIAGFLLVGTLRYAPGTRQFILKKTVPATLPLAVGAQAQSFLTNGLVAYYPFNGNANDASGNGYNGTAYKTTMVADYMGNPGSAYHLNGTNAYIYFGPILPDMQAMTVSAWVNPSNDSNFFVDADWTPGNDLAIGISSVGTGIRCDKPPAPFETGYNFPLDVTIGESWNHLTWTLTTNAIRVYVNGVLVGSSGNLGGVDVGYHDFIIGTMESPQRNIGWAGYWKGDVCKLRIYNRVLSDAEAQALYQYESQPPPSSHRRPYGDQPARVP